MNKMSFVGWYDLNYVNDEDEDMKVDSFNQIVEERLDLSRGNFCDAYYSLSYVFKEYLEYLGK